MVRDLIIILLTFEAGVIRLSAHFGEKLSRGSFASFHSSDPLRSSSVRPFNARGVHLWGQQAAHRHFEAVNKPAESKTGKTTGD